MFNFCKQNKWDGANIVLNKHAGNLAGHTGYVEKHLKDDLFLARVIEFSSYISVQLRSHEFYLEDPEDYPALPILTKKPTKKGGKFMDRMPIFFKWFIYLAVISVIWAFATLVWHVVNHIDTIATFVVHTLILHR